MRSTKVGTLALCAVLWQFSSADTVRAEAAPTTAAAASDDSSEARAARQHFDLGETFYRAGKYEAARLEFETAYRLFPAPLLLWNLGKVAEKQGRSGDALHYYERYTRARRDEGQRQAEAEALAEVGQAIERLRAEAAQQGAPAVPAPVVPASAAPAPPQPQALVAPPPDPSPARRSGRPSALAIGLLAGGGALVLGSIGCGAAALALAEEAQNRSREPYIALQPLFDQGHALDGATIGLGVIGGVALGAGAAVWLVERLRRTHPAVAVGSASPLGR